MARYELSEFLIRAGKIRESLPAELGEARLLALASAAQHDPARQVDFNATIDGLMAYLIAAFIDDFIPTDDAYFRVWLRRILIERLKLAALQSFIRHDVLSAWANTHVAIYMLMGVYAAMYRVIDEIEGFGLERLKKLEKSFGAPFISLEADKKVFFDLVIPCWLPRISGWARGIVGFNDMNIVEDVVQEFCIGFLSSEKFLWGYDPRYGVRFSSYIYPKVSICAKRMKAALLWYPQQMKVINRVVADSPAWHWFRCGRKKKFSFAETLQRMVENEQFSMKRIAKSKKELFSKRRWVGGYGRAIYTGDHSGLVLEDQNLSATMGRQGMPESALDRKDFVANLKRLIDEVDSWIGETVEVKKESRKSKDPSDKHVQAATCVEDKKEYREGDDAYERITLATAQVSTYKRFLWFLIEGECADLPAEVFGDFEQSEFLYWYTIDRLDDLSIDKHKSLGNSAFFDEVEVSGSKSTTDKHLRYCRAYALQNNDWYNRITNLMKRNRDQWADALLQQEAVTRQYVSST